MKFSKKFNTLGICIGKGRIMNISQRYGKVCEWKKEKEKEKDLTSPRYGGGEGLL